MAMLLTNTKPDGTGTHNWLTSDKDGRVLHRLEGLGELNGTIERLTSEVVALRVTLEWLCQWLEKESSNG